MTENVGTSNFLEQEIPSATHEEWEYHMMIPSATEFEPDSDDESREPVKLLAWSLGNNTETSLSYQTAAENPEASEVMIRKKSLKKSLKKKFLRSRKK